ncbi:hypothetical protein FK545_03875 [Planococcus glaciei]|nr:hypothetical protein FK545_03875 [Planococcus glaciei]
MDRSRNKFSASKNQYATDIEDAASTGNKSLEEALIQERDKKIKEIRNNFSEDETVIKKNRGRAQG